MSMDKHPLRIHLSLLPKKVRAGIKHRADDDGFLHGFFIYKRGDHEAWFMDGKNLFDCFMPVFHAQTQDIMRCHTVVYTHIGKDGNRIGELCELTFHFNK